MDCVQRAGAVQCARYIEPSLYEPNGWSNDFERIESV